MTRHNRDSQADWTDRFTTPAVEDLLAALPEEAREPTETLRAALLDVPDLTETLRWCGLPWRWALAYTLTGDSPERDALAYLVPNPAAPSIAFRITHDQVGELRIRKFSRFTRDGLAQARLIAGVCWPEWAFQTPTHTKELTQLFGQLHEHATAAS